MTIAEQLSVAVAVAKVATAPQTLASVLILRGAGQVMSGFWRSLRMVTKLDAVLEQPLLLVTVTI